MTAPKYGTDPGDPLDMLGEEAAEVAQEVFKVKRFGGFPGGRGPDYTGERAIDRLHAEVGDFLAILARLIDDGTIEPGKVIDAIGAKHAKLKEWFGVEPPQTAFIIRSPRL